MTQPTQGQQAPQATQSQIAQVAAVLAAAASIDVAAHAFAGVVGVPLAVAVALLRLDAADPVRRLPAGPSANVVNSQEMTYRAAYLANAGLRIKSRLAAGEGPDEAAAPERALFRAHRAAQRGRAAAAAAVDALARKVGLRLRWRAVMDARTSAECRAAHGHVFTADRPPVIGLPGATHPNCRCVAIPAAEGAGVVTVDEAVRAAHLGSEAA